MGVKNGQFYKATKHYTERAHERFGVQNDDGSSVRFFRQQERTCNYVGVSTDKSHREAEIWQNDEVVFILDPKSYLIITTYPIDFLFGGEKGDTNIKDSSIEAIVRSVDNEIFNEFVDFANNNEENISRIMQIMLSMKGTRRRDYRENQINELQTLLSSVSNELQVKNIKKNKLEEIKQTLTK